MKPRILRSRGLWYCWLRGGSCAGLGYTPLEAYQDWQSRMPK